MINFSSIILQDFSELFLQKRTRGYGSKKWEAFQTVFMNNRSYHRKVGKVGRSYSDVKTFKHFFKRPEHDTTSLPFPTKIFSEKRRNRDIGTKRRTDTDVKSIIFAKFSSSSTFDILHIMMHTSTSCCEKTTTTQIYLITHAILLFPVCMCL